MISRSRGAYPVSEERDARLRDDREVRLRPTRTSDAGALQELFFRLTEDDVRSRFFQKLTSLTDSFAQHLCSVSYDEEMAFAAVVGPRESERIVGTSCYYLDPSTGLQIVLDTHRADARKAEPVSLDLEFAQAGGEDPTPYEVLLHAAMTGRSVRFTRQDGVEETWRIMQPLLDAPPPVHPYAPGTWGPEAAAKVVAGHGKWYGPWVTS